MSNPGELPPSCEAKKSEYRDWLRGLPESELQRGKELVLDSLTGDERSMSNEDFMRALIVGTMMHEKRKTMRENDYREEFYSIIGQIST